MLTYGAVTFAQLVKLLSYDCKVTGLSPRNSLLCKNMIRLRIIHQMMRHLPKPCVCENFSILDCFFLSMSTQHIEYIVVAGQLMKIVNKHNR